MRGGKVTYRKGVTMLPFHWEWSYTLESVVERLRFPLQQDVTEESLLGPNLLIDTLSDICFLHTHFYYKINFMGLSLQNSRNVSEEESLRVELERESDRDTVDFRRRKKKKTSYIQHFYVLPRVITLTFLLKSAVSY